MPFEETIYRFNRSVLIPEAAEKQINLFFESVTEDYYELFEETAADILARIEQKLRLLTSVIAPEIFKKAVDADVDPSKMAGITITVDKQFNSDCDGGQPCENATIEVVKDPELAEELEDENEAETLEKVLGDDESPEEEAEEVEKAVEENDIVAAENKARREQELATEPEDYEGAEAEEEAEESPAEETAEHPDQPGAIEIDLDMEQPELDSTGKDTNDHDLEVATGSIEGEHLDDKEAQLPGSADASEVKINGDEVDIDDEELGEPSEDDVEELESKEELIEKK
jgi:hypothetical protein